MTCFKSYDELSQSSIEPEIICTLLDWNTETFSITFIQKFLNLGKTGSKFELIKNEYHGLTGTFNIDRTISWSINGSDVAIWKRSIEKLL